MAKKHDINMIASWARENNVRGYEHLDPVNRQKQRTWATQRANQENRNYGEKRYESKKS